MQRIDRYLDLLAARAAILNEHQDRGAVVAEVFLGIASSIVVIGDEEWGQRIHRLFCRSLATAATYALPITMNLRSTLFDDMLRKVS